MRTERNLSRRAVGVGAMLPFMVWVVLLVAIFGANVVARQRISESRQRMDAMKREMGDIETSLISIGSQQQAMLTEESLKSRLSTAGSPLVKIPQGSQIRIPEKRTRDTGVAMDSTPTPARR